MTTIQDVLSRGRQLLIQAGQESARLDAQVLMEHVLDIDRATLYAYPEREVTANQEQRFFSLIERRAQGEPIAYLIGHEEFYGLDFLVDKRVLIPRPETELLVETALRILRERLNMGQVLLVADIGTGSGAIPITLAVEEPRLPYLYAVDISSDALEVARLNCQRHHVEQRVRLLYGDLLAPLPDSVDVLIANLPYVGTNEMDVLEPDVVNYEPHLALFSGPLGLDLLRRFFIDAYQSNKLKPGGILLLEVGYQQHDPLVRLLQEVWPHAKVEFSKDYAGWDRVLQVHT